MFDVHETICNSHGEIDEDRVEKYIDGLMKEFAASPEAQPIINTYGGIGWSATMMEYSINYFGETPATMGLPDLNEVVFEIFPRKVSIEPESAPTIVAELRAFWSFLQGCYNLPNAEPILAAFTEEAGRRLRKELADPANFGMAKSLVTLGFRAGFDMTSQQGLDEFMLAYNSNLLNKKLAAIGLGLPDPGLPIPNLGLSGLSSRERKEKRKQQKAKRLARKRNHK